MYSNKHFVNICVYVCTHVSINSTIPLSHSLINLRTFENIYLNVIIPIQFFSYYCRLFHCHLTSSFQFSNGNPTRIKHLSFKGIRGKSSEPEASQPLCSLISHRTRKLATHNKGGQWTFNQLDKTIFYLRWVILSTYLLIK